MSLSVLLTNLIVIFILFNLIVFLGFSLARAIPRWLAPISKHAEKSAPGAVALYPGWAGPKFGQLISETLAAVEVGNYEYDEITQLRLRPLHGRYVNVAEGGFRQLGSQGPWPLDRSALNVFVFGGSTTFGFYMDDDHTIPSYLQQFARAGSRERVNLYNFGRPGYTSSQELLLYLSLLRDGSIPTIAVFVDGLNDCQEWTSDSVVGLPWPEAYVYSAIEAEKDGLGYMLLQRLPMSDLARSISAGVKPGQSDDTTTVASRIETFIVNRWLKNKKAIEALSRAYAVKVAFVWQPVATYKYDLSYDAFGRDQRLASEKYVALVYPAIEMMANRGLLGENFLSLAAIQQDRKETLYVDPWHYNESFSAEIASKINPFLQARGMLDQGGARQPDAVGRHG